MRLIKILGIAVAVLIVFWVVSAALHLLYLIGVGLVIAAAIFLAAKGWGQYRNAMRRHDQRRQERARQKTQRRAADLRSIEPRPQQPGRLPTPGEVDLDAELARLRGETKR